MSSSFKLLRDCCIPLVMLGLGGCAFWRRLLAVLLNKSVCSVSSGLIADSTLATISIHTDQTPPLTPQTMFDACIQNFFQVSTLYRVEGGKPARIFRKGCPVLWGNREMTEKYDYCIVLVTYWSHDNSNTSKADCINKQNEWKSMFFYPILSRLTVFLEQKLTFKN